MLNRSNNELAAVGHSDAPARIAVLIPQYYALVDRLAALVATGKSGPAALLLGDSEQPGGIEAKLIAELHNADSTYGVQASQSKTVASLVTISAIGFLLIAFSIAFHHSDPRSTAQPPRRDHRRAHGARQPPEAVRRHGAGHRLAQGDTDVTLGIFDLDGFKAYNDTFGHPGRRRPACPRSAAVSQRRSATRATPTGSAATNSSSSTAAARRRRPARRRARRLSANRAPASRSAARSAPRASCRESLSKQALHVADQRLYAEKRSAQRGADRKPRTRCCKCSPSRTTISSPISDTSLHSLKVPQPRSAAPEQIELTRARCRAPRHRQGSDPRLDPGQAGPAHPERTRFMERHSAIGERIVAAAPTSKQSRRSSARRTNAPTAPDIPTVSRSSRFRSAHVSSPSSTPSTP